MRNITEAANRLAKADDRALEGILRHDPDMVRDVAAAFLSAVQQPSLDTVAAAVHRARFPEGREPTPFEGEQGEGREYCYRIATAAIAAGATAPELALRKILYLRPGGATNNKYAIEVENICRETLGI